MFLEIWYHIGVYIYIYVDTDIHIHIYMYIFTYIYIHIYIYYIVYIHVFICNYIYIYTSTLIWISYRIDVVSWVNCWLTLHNLAWGFRIPSCADGRQRVPLRSLAVKCLSDSRCRTEKWTRKLHHYTSSWKFPSKICASLKMKKISRYLPDTLHSQNEKPSLWDRPRQPHRPAPLRFAKGQNLQRCNTSGVLPFGTQDLMNLSPLRKRQCRIQRFLFEYPAFLNVYITMENHHAIFRKTHYKTWQFECSKSGFMTCPTEQVLCQALWQDRT